jgi:L-fuculose-phosphate aldolase
MAAKEHDEERLRIELVETMQAMAARGLNRGTSGNASVRCGDSLLITPSGITPDRLTPASLVLIDGEGRGRASDLKPSSEWRMHWGILTNRADVNAVVHCHSRHATILACVGRSIPAIHYMVAVSGRGEIPVAPYDTFGSRELADAVVATLQGGYACLMANHGQVAIGVNLARALAIADEVEEQAAVYWGALAIGGPTLLTQSQINDVLAQFSAYGQRR